MEQEVQASILGSTELRPLRVLLLDGDAAHLALLQDKERFDRAFDVFFRAIGDKDPFLEYFLADDKRCEAAGIHQKRTIYNGIHDWNVWRQCIRDYACLIFR